MNKKIITHPGIFHADEIFAVAHLEYYYDAEIPVERKIPTQEELENPEIIIVDVGSQYLPEKNNYDHHQEIIPRSKDTNISYASFGLIAKHFPISENKSENNYYEKCIVKPVDAIDIGYKQSQSNTLPVSSALNLFNPTSIERSSEEKRLDNFLEAKDVAYKLIKRALIGAKDKSSSYDAVLNAKLANNCRVLILDEYVPWAEHIHYRKDSHDIQFVVFPSLRGGWNVQQVTVFYENKEPRTSLPRKWSGLKDKQLQEKSGVQDATFCHINCFLGAAETKKGAIEMAEKAIYPLEKNAWFLATVLYNNIASTELKEKQKNSAFNYLKSEYNVSRNIIDSAINFWIELKSTIKTKKYHE